MLGIYFRLWLIKFAVVANAIKLTEPTKIQNNNELSYNILIISSELPLKLQLNCILYANLLNKPSNSVCVCVYLDQDINYIVRIWDISTA